MIFTFAKKLEYHIVLISALTSKPKPQSLPNTLCIPSEPIIISHPFAHEEHLYVIVSPTFSLVSAHVVRDSPTKHESFTIAVFTNTAS